jgi:PAS domain S-box-containing protein
MSRKILLVEDEALIAIDEARTIERHGYEIEIAHRGEEAVETAVSDPDIELVLMDIDLGRGMDGTEAAQHILARRELPIVFLTGHSEKEYVERVKKITNYGYVLKNSGEFVLIESINMAFNLFQAHRNLREKEREQREVLENIDSAVLRLDKEGTITFFSRGAEKIFGFSAEEVTGQSELGLMIPEEDRHGRDLRQMYRDLLSDPDAFAYNENENVREDGTRLWMAWRNKKVFDDRGNFLYIQSIGHDITEKKETEEALKRSEHRLKKTQEIARVGSWHLDLSADTLSWSDEIYRMFGLSPDEFAATYEAFLERVHPEDREAVDEAYTGSLRENRDEYEIDHRIIRKDTGEVRFVHERCEHYRDASGAIVGSLGMVQDITERKQAEQALAEREENLRVTLHSIGDAVITTTPEGRIVLMNPVAQQLTGWSQEAASGQALRDVITLINAETRETVDDPVKEVITTGATVGLANHTCLVSQDGTEYQIADSAAPITNDDGRINGVVMVFRDVSEAYRKDRRLRESEQRYRSLVEDSPIGIFQSHSDGRFLHVNSHMASLLGANSRDEAVQFYQHLASQLYVRTGRREDFLRYLQSGGSVVDFEFEARRVDGEIRWLTLNARISEQNEDGSFIIDGYAFDITARKRAEEEYQRAVEEKQFLMNELNHRVKNNLLMISSLLSMKNAILGDRVDLSDIKSQIEAIRIVHEQLFQTEEVTHINIRNYFQELLETIFTSFTSKPVEIDNRVETVELPTKPAISLALILNEIATNAIKHGFNEEEPPRFTVTMQSDGTGNHTLSMENSGNPLPPDIDIETADTLGLQLIRSLVHQLEGDIEISSRQPPRFTLRFAVRDR